MGKIDYQKIYDKNKHDWYAMTEEPQKYEALLAGHYSDSNHFVYELIQNAEDEHATKAVIIYEKEGLTFFHDGDPFDEADVKGVSSMLMGTKDRNDAQTIGRFGMGFKSVFKYTHEPRIYSNGEAFAITNYLLPVPLNDGWDYKEACKSVKCQLGEGKATHPFWNSNNLTKIVIPFTKRQNDGSIVKISGQDVVQKLESLDGQILLFLTWIKELYWIDRSTGKYAQITLSTDENDDALVTCRIDGSEYDGKEQIARFLKFTKVFEHDEMENANVSVAYKLNARANNINAVEDNRINVYFPTKDETCLPFLVHGSFETAVSREKLMEPSDFNNDLYYKLGELIGESLDELKKRKLITQNFFRNILLPSFEEERIEDLQDMIAETVSSGAYIPDSKGEYREISELQIPIPFAISDFKEGNLLVDSFETEQAFVGLSDEKGSGFNDYFVWLRDSLEVETFDLEDWSVKLKGLNIERVISKGSADYTELLKLYDFLLNYRESEYESKGGYSYRSTYSRSGPYESAIKACLKKAWENLRQAALVLNQENRLIAAYHEDMEKIYLNSSSNYKRVVASAIVNLEIAKDYKSLLEDGFQINEFDNFQYVKEKVIEKYVKGDTINFDNEDDEKIDQEYADDIKQILQLISDGANVDLLREMLAPAYVIRIVNAEGDIQYSTPSGAYALKADEDLDLKIYLSGLEKEIDFVDEEFFRNHGITIEQLKKLGIVSSIFKLGGNYHEGYGGGDRTWRALGNYRPNITIDFWNDNVEYIQENPDEELAKKKSSIMLNVLLAHYDKFSGQVRYNKTNQYTEDEESRFLSSYVRSEAWIYNKNEELCQIEDISRFELNDDIYGFKGYTKEAYSSLGFIEKEQDATANVYDALDALNSRAQQILMSQWARQNGYTLTKADDFGAPEEDSSGVFDSSAFVSDEFPARRVKNLESLLEHVRQQFFCADPTKYEKVLMQIRTSKTKATHKQYAFGMYTNRDGVRICQMCRKPNQSAEAVEIANFGIEMDQLHLCLCANCASKYKTMKSRNKDAFKEGILEDILNIWVDPEDEYEDDEYELELNDDDSIWFNQTHLMEVQEIFELLGKYGTPDDANEVEIEQLREASEEEIPEYFNAPKPSDDGVIHDGNFISYKNLFTGQCHDTEVQASKYPLHKLFLGHAVGDVVKLNGKSYEIIAVL